MKKIFIIFVSILIMVSCFTFTIFADTPSSIDNRVNYLNSNRYSTYRLYTSPDSFIDQVLFDVYLAPNTYYTFMSTSSSRRFFVSRPTLFNNYNSVFLYNYNYISIPYNFSYGDYTSFEISAGSLDGQIDIDFKSSLTRDYYLLYNEIILEPGTYFFNDFSTVPSSRAVSYITYGDSYIYSGQSFTLTERTEVECRLAIYSSFNSDLSISPMLTKDFPIDYFIPGVRTVLYNNQTTYVYTFKTSDFDVNDNHFVVGLSDSTQFVPSYDLFSRNLSISTAGSLTNSMYLIEGSLSPSGISTIYGGQQFIDGYNSGYDDGYKVGETDGLSSTSFMRSTIFTILSAPFVIVSNALDFDLLGINIYNLVKISITVLLIAWVITRLKGRE